MTYLLTTLHSFADRLDRISSPPNDLELHELRGDIMTLIDAQQCIDTLRLHVEITPDYWELHFAPGKGFNEVFNTAMRLKNYAQLNKVTFHYSGNQVTIESEQG